MSGKPYPTAPPAGSYPGQTAYPTAQYPQPQYQTGNPYQQQPYGQPAGMYGAPPPYASQPNEPPPPYTPYPGQAPMHGGAPPPGTMPPQHMYPQQQPPTTMMMPGLFDAGARFDGSAQPRIPPPPPGVAPNMAQMAAMQGHTVVGTQQRSNWFSGNSGSGNDWGL